MAPPTPLICSVEDCTFSTPLGTPTWDLMVTLLTTHTQAVHATPGGGGPPAASGSSSKLEKLPVLSLLLFNSCNYRQPVTPD